MADLKLQYQALSGKTVLIIGTGGVGRRYLWQTFADLNLKVILVHSKWVEYACEMVHRFIEYNIEDSHTSDHDHAANIIGLLGDSVKEVSACCTFGEFFIYLNAVLCQKLGLRGLSPESARIVRSKAKTYNVLESFSDTKMYSPVHVRIEDEKELQQVTWTDFPAIMKPEYSVCTGGVTMVFSIGDCVDTYKKLHKTHGVIWRTGSYDKSMILMEYMDGLCYTVDIILFDGEVVKYLLSVNLKFHMVGKKVPDEFADSVTCYSSCLPDSLTKELCCAAYRCCRNLGLFNGVFNVEMKLTSSGFKLVEINGRPGSYRRSSVFILTQNIDIHVAQVLISFGIRPMFYEAPDVYAIACYLYESLHESIASCDVKQKIDRLCANNSCVVYKVNVTPEDTGGFLEPYASLVIIDKTSLKSARERMICMFEELKLINDYYDVEKLTIFCNDNITAI